MPSIQNMLAAAIGHHQAGRLAEAEGLYRQILKQEPNHPDALNLLGAIAGAAGHLDAAIELIGRAVKINPRVANFHGNLGETYRLQRKFDLAIASLREAIRLDPKLDSAWYSLGGCFQATERLDESIDAFGRAIALDPNLASAHFDLGMSLSKKEMHQQAIAEFSRAVELNPDLSGAYNNLGCSLQIVGRLEEAVGAFEKAVKISPDYFDAQNNLGAALIEMGLHHRAVVAYERAAKIDPSSNFARSHHAFLLLRTGDLERGWREFELLADEGDYPMRKNFPRPRWDGSDLTGKTIVLYGEQGFGDHFQFLRYIPLLAKRGASVILGCAPSMVRLSRSSFPDVECIPSGEKAVHCDVHCPLIRLPLVFGTNLSNIPAEVPFLKLEADLVARWSQKLGARQRRLRVGLAWAGSPVHKNDVNRSIRLEQLARLGDVKNVEFHGLQKGEAAIQIATAPAGLNLRDWGADLSDWAETAALIENLDLVICVDTAIAHVAGGLAKRVWVMLPFVADWRWLLDRQDSPWYPTMRLFRQPKAGDWDSVIEEIAHALRELAGGE